MVKQPMTTEELFSKVCEILKEKNLLPDLLDYANPACEPVLITNCDFVLKSNLDYGRSEGIYLDLYLKFYKSGTSVNFGTFKTLNTDREAMHFMAGILADFIIEFNSFVRTNADDFDWEGFYVYPLDPEGNKVHWHYFCDSMEEALRKKNTSLEKYEKVIIRNNETREETVYDS